MKRNESAQSRLLRLQYALFCLGKTLRAKKATQVTSDRSESKNAFTVINDEGKEVVCNVLFSFDNADASRHYIVYTDNTKDQEGNVQVYASMYNPQQEDKMELLPIETPEEWATIEDILTSLQEEIKNGEPIDSDDEDDDILEPLSYVAWKKVNNWTDRLHFPVGALLPYIIGTVLLHLVNPNPLPLWADVGFMAIELIIMRITYDDIEQMHTAAAWSITGCLYMGILMFLLDPLMAKLYPNTSRITVEPWGLRGIAIVSVLIVSLWGRWKKRKRRKAWQK